jgi:hypothetical protein
MNIRLSVAFALVLFVKLESAHADWLDNAWSDRSVAAHGNPAITLHRDGVSVALPAKTLGEAYSEGGMTTKDVLRIESGRRGYLACGVRTVRRVTATASRRDRITQYTPA